MMKYESHAHQTVARKINARIDYAAIAFAADHSILFRHGFGDVDLADLCQKKRTAKALRDRFQRRSRGEISHDGASLFVEHVSGRQHERVFFADWHSCL